MKISIALLLGFAFIAAAVGLAFGIIPALGTLGCGFLSLCFFAYLSDPPENP